ncbi:hypothetical protein Scep_026050 [Stephania cephalantha]|uniref:Copia protein n=1 Tax=Stephania cephalantha TaxID=152367 RepID=A0AAP0EJD8_9MAGN
MLIQLGLLSHYRRSTTGYVIFLDNSPISWKLKKQAIASCSSVEAEYHAMANANSELVWLRVLLLDLGVHVDQTVQLFCDNQADLHIAGNPVFHE